MLRFVNMHKSTDYRVIFFLKGAKCQVIWPVFYINCFIFNREIHNKKYFKTNKMSTQKETKKPNLKGEKSGNITAYSKSKLSNKPICRKTIKSIKQQLKANGKTIEEAHSQ